MNKLLGVWVLLGLLLSAGCASNKNYMLTEEETYLTIEQALDTMKIKAESTVQDVDKDGAADIRIVYVPEQKEKMTLYRHSYIMGAVTGVVSALKGHTTWPANLVYFKFEGKTYKAAVDDCYTCANLKKSEIDACIDRIWVRVK